MLELGITQTRHPHSIPDGKNVFYVQHPSKMREYLSNVHKIGGVCTIIMFNIKE